MEDVNDMVYVELGSYSLLGWFSYTASDTTVISAYTSPISIGCPNGN
jgi:hypothetical protein